METTIYKKIIVGGWAAFAESNGLNKKEQVENFDWIHPEGDQFYYNDVRGALDRVEGSREWLRNYMFDEDNEKHPYNCEMGHRLSREVTDLHSGASFSCLMNSYRRALNDWDGFVFNTKRVRMLREFKNQQIDTYSVSTILWLCNSCLNEKDPVELAKREEEIISRAAKFGFTGNVQEIQTVLKQIREDQVIIANEDMRNRVDSDHRDLMESIIFLYQHPIRWFDTPSGCSLRPVHPTRITKLAMAEMEAKNPGYSKHIENVLVAMGSPRKPAYDDGAGGIFSRDGREAWDTFLRSQKVIS